MNKDRRKQIAAVIDRIQNGDVNDLLEEVKREIEAIMEDEVEALENLPESIQDGDRGMAMQEAIDALDNAMGETDADALFESILMELEGAME